MVTYKTLEVFLEKVKTAKEAIEVELRSARDHMRYLEDSSVAVRAQIDTLTQLMDADNPQKIEIPTAGDNIEELFDKRLGDPELPDAEEMHKQRQEGVYTREATDIVDQIDEMNNETSEDASVNPA